MADLKRTFTIEIAGVKESVTNLESLEGILSKMEKQVETINKNGGFSVVSKEMNKNTREAIDLAKAEEIAQGGVVSSYREKQKALTALGKGDAQGVINAGNIIQQLVAEGKISSQDAGDIKRMMNSTTEGYHGVVTQYGADFSNKWTATNNAIKTIETNVKTIMGYKGNERQ